MFSRLEELSAERRLNTEKGKEGVNENCIVQQTLLPCHWSDCFMAGSHAKAAFFISVLRTKIVKLKEATSQTRSIRRTIPEARNHTFLLMELNGLHSTKSFFLGGGFVGLHRYRCQSALASPHGPFR